jgi:hypothetical protein
MTGDIITRVWIDGQLVREDAIDADPLDPEGTEERVIKVVADHHALCLKAHLRGSLWLVEIERPDLPENSRYIRFGTDQKGMVGPEPLTPHSYGQHPFFAPKGGA